MFFARPHFGYLPLRHALEKGDHVPTLSRPPCLVAARADKSAAAAPQRVAVEALSFTSSRLLLHLYNIMNIFAKTVKFIYNVPKAWCQWDGPAAGFDGYFLRIAVEKDLVPEKVACQNIRV